MFTNHDLIRTFKWANKEVRLSDILKGKGFETIRVWSVESNHNTTNYRITSKDGIYYFFENNKVMHTADNLRSCLKYGYVTGALTKSDLV